MIILFQEFGNNFSLQIRKDDGLICSKVLSIQTESHSLNFSEPLSNEAQGLFDNSTESVINQRKSQLTSSEVVYESKSREDI